MIRLTPRILLTLLFAEAGVALQLSGANSREEPVISRRSDGQLDRIQLDAEEVRKRGSVCLDGSQPAVYFEPADTKADPTAATKWVLTFPGGGWCKTEEECAKRSKFPMASRRSIENNFAIFGNSDIKSSKASNSPFAAYNHAVLWYCDGGIFAGDREETLSVRDPNDGTKNVTLYFRGRRVLEHMIDTLAKPKYGLSSATEVLLAGGSTGGFATYMHADFVAARLPKSVKKFRAVPAAGWFSSAPGWMNHRDYLQEMKEVYTMHGMAGAGPAACYDALKGEDAWKCIFADNSYAYSTTPMYVLQTLDQFMSIRNETSQMLSLRNFLCVGHQLSGTQCSNDDAGRLNSLLDGFVNMLKGTDKFSRAGEGGFLSSCSEHEFYLKGAFFSFTDGSVTMAEAVYKWWAADSNTKADWHLPCRLHDNPPYQCTSCGGKSSSA